MSFSKNESREQKIQRTGSSESLSSESKLSLTDIDFERIEQQIQENHMDEDSLYYEFEIENIVDEIKGGHSTLLIINDITFIVRSQ